MQVNQVDYITATSFMTHDPKLCEHSLTDEELYNYKNDPEWTLDNTYTFLIIEDKALLKIEGFTNISVVVHMYIKSELWGKPICDDITKAFITYLEDNTKFLKIIVPSPRPCVNVIKHALDSGFELEAVLPATIVWRGKVESLTLLSYYLKRGNP